MVIVLFYRYIDIFSKMSLFVFDTQLFAFSTLVTAAL